MVILSLFSWWYTTGWLTLVRKCGQRIQGALGFFSVPLLASTLFSPFRQISAGPVRGSLNVQLQALGDKIFSRVIGAIVRSLLILIGVATVLLLAVVSVVVCLAWPLLPVAPIVGFFAMGAPQ